MPEQHRESFSKVVLRGNDGQNQRQKEQAIKDEMSTLVDEAKRLAIEGVTSIDEIIRVL